MAKGLYPSYRPAGQQAIKLLDKLPYIPIVIVHSENDQQLSYTDACAVYYGLRKNGNDAVYFISQTSTGHINILHDSPNEANAVRNILKHHEVISDDSEAEKIDLEKFQPNPAPYKHLYDNLKKKETIHTYIERALGIGFVACCVKMYQWMVR